MAEPAFTYRPFEPTDAEAMGRLYFDSVRGLGGRRYSQAQVEAWAPAPLPPEQVRARAGDGRLTLLALDAAGQVAAYGDLEADGHIDQLYARPDAVGTGVAGEVLDRLIAAARAAGTTRLYVEASELARPLFERKGFDLVRRRDFEVRGVAIHNYAMALMLA